VQILLITIWDICRLKGSPQNLPTSRTLLIYAVSSYALVSFILAMFQLSVGQAFFAALVDITIMVVLSYVILWMKMVPQRWYQMLTAMAGVSLVIALFAAPMVLVRFIVGPESANAGILSLLILCLVVWSFAVFAHIFRHTLDIPYFAALLISGMYTYISMRIINILFFTAEIGA